MRLRLKRISNSLLCTMGVLLNEETALPFMVTLELPDKRNQRSISCIPNGLYNVKSYYSEKYENAYEIKEVYGRTAILIHSGNTTDDIEGCILVGDRFGSLNGSPAVLDSRKALETLRILYPVGFELIIE